MKFKNIILVGVAVFGFSGCASNCTEEELQEKLMQITAKVQEIATTGDMGKLMELSKKANDISQGLKGSDDDLQAACTAADQLLDEL